MLGMPCLIVQVVTVVMTDMVGESVDGDSGEEECVFVDELLGAEETQTGGFQPERGRQGEV